MSYAHLVEREPTPTIPELTRHNTRLQTALHEAQCDADHWRDVADRMRAAVFDAQRALERVTLQHLRDARDDLARALHIWNTAT